MSYEDLHVHYVMLKDRVRTEGYRSALTEVVRPGDVVADLGCGTGILSIFASRAGAARVYAMERTSIVQVAERIAAKNGITNITFLARKSDAVVIPEAIDVLVSEWMGVFLFHEKMFEAVVRLRDRVLAKGGKMIPSHARLHGALVTDEAAFKACDFFNRCPYDVDYSPVGEWLFNRTQVKTFSPQALASEPFTMGELDMLTCTAELPKLTATFTQNRAAVAHGICGWFSVDLSPSHSFDTGPWSETTHWEQMYFPFAKPVSLAAGDEVTVEIRPLRVGKDQTPAWQWSIQTPRDRLAQDDFMHHVWMQVAEDLETRRGSG